VTVVLDAYALIAALRGEPAAAEVADVLRRRDVVMTVARVAEVVDHVVRVAGVDIDEVLLDLASIGVLDAPPLDSTTAIAAGALRAARYHRSTCAVSLADCVAAETARRLGAALCASDPHLLDVCHFEGIDVVVLPDSTGERWSNGH
jgi:predicted nucleic acid-binding protein